MFSVTVRESSGYNDILEISTRLSPSVRFNCEYDRAVNIASTDFSVTEKPIVGRQVAKGDMSSSFRLETNVADQSSLALGQMLDVHAIWRKF